MQLMLCICGCCCSWPCPCCLLLLTLLLLLLLPLLLPLLLLHCHCCKYVSKAVCSSSNDDRRKLILDHRAIIGHPSLVFDPVDAISEIDPRLVPWAFLSWYLFIYLLLYFYRRPSQYINHSNAQCSLHKIQFSEFQFADSIMNYGYLA